MAERSPDGPGPGEQRDVPRGAFASESALGRLEATLSAYPYDAALPGLATILDDAGVDRELLREDDRAAKLLHEAIVARPLSSLGVVRRARTEVELLTLEVSVLRDRLDDPTAGARDVEAVAARLRAIRAAIEEIRDDL